MQMETWFTNERFIHKVLEEGLDVIGMAKDCRQRYGYKGKFLSLKELILHTQIDPASSILGSITVSTKKYHIPVKLVFVRNWNKKGEYIVLLSTDCSLSASEIVRRYGNHWDVECCFKDCKSLLKLGKEFHRVSYDLTVSSTFLILTRFILLEWMRRKHNDDKTIAELFFVCCKDIQDMEFTAALPYIHFCCRDPGWPHNHRRNCPCTVG
ncbi:MAG: transposase [Lachnospiraceae bacterium]|nr:transposase [Lachnospiraceae bacterium]